MYTDKLTLICIPVWGLSVTVQRENPTVATKPSNMNYHFCSGKKVRTAPGPQFIRLSKYNCTANLRSSPPFINSNLLVSGTTPHSSNYRADPMGFYSRTIGKILSFRTCGFVAHINCCLGFFLPFVRPLTPFTSMESGRSSNVLPPEHTYVVGVCFYSVEMLQY